MKQIVLSVCAFLLTLSLTAVAAAPAADPAVGAAETEYAQAVEQANKELAQKLEKAKATLLAKLKTSMQATTKRGDVDGAVALRSRIEAIEAIPAGGPVETTAASRKPRTIDLLALVDPQKDAVRGTWSLKKGVLVSDTSRGAALELPYRPPAQYDFTVEFSRVAGDEALNLDVAGANSQVHWVVGGYRNTRAGFELVKGVRADRNVTGKRSDGMIENGRRYTTVVKVRKDGVQGFIDGKLVSEWKTDFSDLSLLNGLELRDPKAIGLGSYESSFAFKSIKVTEITGTGELLREAKADPAK